MQRVESEKLIQKMLPYLNNQQLLCLRNALDELITTENKQVDNHKDGNHNCLLLKHALVG